MEEEILKSLGLSENEVKTYLANLRTGSSLVQNIARHANLNRTSTYDVLNSLKLKGFTSYTIKSGKRFYQATSPKKLICLLKEKEEKLKSILPELNSISNNIGKKPSIEIYAGKNGIRTIFEEILDESRNFYCLASKKHLLHLFEFYFPNFVKRRRKKKIKVRLIVDAIPLDKTAPFKLINKKIKTSIFLYNKKIAMISLGENEPIGILIHEKNFYETQKMMFDILWDNL